MKLRLNSKTLITIQDVDLGNNSGSLIAVSYGNLLIIHGYVKVADSDVNYKIAAINNVQLQYETQIIVQSGLNPSDPYCTFGSIHVNGEITIYKSVENEVYRFNGIAAIK